MWVLFYNSLLSTVQGPCSGQWVPSLTELSLPSTIACSHDRIVAGQFGKVWECSNPGALIGRCPLGGAIPQVAATPACARRCRAEPGKHMPEQYPLKKRISFLACKLCVPSGLARYGNDQIPGNLEIRNDLVQSRNYRVTDAPS